MQTFGQKKKSQEDLQEDPQAPSQEPSGANK